MSGIQLGRPLPGRYIKGANFGRGLPQTTAFKLLSCPALPGGHPSLGWTVQTNVGDQRSAQKQSLLMLLPLVERRGRRITWSFLHSNPYHLASLASPSCVATSANIIIVMDLQCLDVTMSRTEVSICFILLVLFFGSGMAPVIINLVKAHIPFSPRRSLKWARLQAPVRGLGRRRVWMQK